MAEMTNVSDGSDNGSGVDTGLTERKRAEAALRAERDRAQSYLDTAEVMLLALDLEGQVTLINRYGCQILGYEEEELLGQNWFDACLPPQLTAEVKGVFRRLMEGEVEQLEYYENPVLTKWGEERIVAWHNAFLRDEAGRAVGILSSGEDITERKQAEDDLLRAKAELEAQNTRLQALYRVGQLLNSTLQPESILNHLVDEAMRVTRASHGQVLVVQEDKGGFERHAQRGFSPDEEEMGWTRLLPLDKGVNARAYTSRRAVCVDDVRAEADYYPLIADTRAELAVPIIRDGQVLGNLDLQSPEVGSFHDADLEYLSALADQVSIALANAQLFRIVEQAKRDWETTFDAMQDAVVLVDRERRILRVNHAFADMAKRPFTDVVGQSYHHVIEGEVCSSPVCPLVQASREGQPATCLHTYEGRLFQMQFIPAPEGMAEMPERSAHAIYVLRDITEQRQLEEQFRQAQKMEAIGRLAGGIAHDFNNILTVIRISSQLMDKQLRPADPLRIHLQRISESGERAIKLVKQLLSFSRKEIVEPQILDLNRIVSDLSRMLMRIIGEDVELNLDLTDGLWPVYMDPTQVDQVIINLAVNARDAMPGGGTLTIKTANVALGETDVPQHLGITPGEYVRLTITDTGVGMDSEVKAHLFEPFFTTKKPGRGTGLGLATVYGIVKQSAGHIHVTSEVGLGTTFRIHLPRTLKTQLRAKPQSLPPPRSVWGNETILLVEDEKEVRTLSFQILKAHGYQVLVAEDAAEAILISQHHAGPIHLLLTDVVMPRLSGGELVETVQAQRPDTRVLFMTGHSDETVARHGVSTPGVALLRKPFAVESLTQKVRAVLDGGV